MSVHGDDDLYADLYGNDDYNAAEDEILNLKTNAGEKTESPPVDAPQPSNTDSAPTRSATSVAQTPASSTPKPVETAPEPLRQAPAPIPQIGSSIATYTSDEGATLSSNYGSAAYGSMGAPIQSYESNERQSNVGSNFSDSNQGGAGGYDNESDPQKPVGYTNGAVYESSNPSGFGGGQRGGYGGFNAGAGGGRRFDSVRPSEMKDEGKMFVGGLNWDTTDESLRSYFSQFGKVDACTIMRDASGRSRGFAFLTFEDPAAVNAVMVREHFLDGKIIDPKRAIPRTEHARTQKLFVGGLASTVTSESMRDFFAQYGKVIDANVMVDRDSSRSKGFGFVTFEDQEGVDKLLQLGPLELDGKLMDIKLAQPRGTYQRNEGFNNNQGNEGAYNNYGRQQAGNTPFDPQAMAALYARVQMINQNQTGMGMGMSAMGGMGGMGMGAMGMNGMGMGMGGGFTNGMMGAAGGNMGGGAGMMGNRGQGGGNVMAGVPRGPAAMRSGMGQGQGQNQGGGMGPNRYNTKGQHNYRPY
ncbi:RNA recognition motif 1 in RNA-binding protein musashi-like musashi protein [Rhizoctonia solani AG-3 Rhs1AP]|uniref:RNA recognition motif 1 in RNA-binding protein musashi-like musashi protein n=3 Tax=Rhizoctonia solani TaxID=456999 RepID=A0A074S086_9AGAM|nr:RNA recognition motif 1 in RNA-binding protein musashi-like musashi protein [Rhizoctonia solani AG-3 Rhs1AP]KEP52669.1 RNA recognition motif 1 in RNA-binding protein musashi-like musashi protein [Rhizoctonia solani 123E]